MLSVRACIHFEIFSWERPFQQIALPWGDVLREETQAVTRTASLQMWDRWSRPYIERIIQATKREHPTVPITVYANGSGGLLERLGSTGADVVGLDWTVDMADARTRLGPAVSVQACVDLAPPWMHVKPTSL